MTPFFKSAVEGYKAALDAYTGDVKQLATIEKRLISEGRASAKKGDEPKCKTIEKQLVGVHAGLPAAEERFNAAVDEINQGVVMRFRAICSLDKTGGLGSAGARYLLGECDEFGKAKGDHVKRQSLYESIITVAEALADSITDARAADDVRVTRCERPAAVEPRPQHSFHL